MIRRQSFITVRVVVAAALIASTAVQAHAAAPSAVKRGVIAAPATVGVAQAKAQTQNVQSTSSLLAGIPVSGILSDGGVFNGTATISSFTYVDAKGFCTSGTLNGTATTVDGTQIQVSGQVFTEVKTPLVQTLVPVATAGLLGGSAHQILQLDLGPITLDSGLVADISAVAIDVTSLTGVDATLGNLLWTVAGLLSPVTGLVTGLLLPLLMTLLSLINPLLGGLLGGIL